MIFCESIPREQFMRNLSMFRANRPELAWGLDDPPDGAGLYYLPAHDAYFATQPTASKHATICSAFRFGAGAGGAAAAVFAAARSLGFQVADLDAYAPAARAWRKAGALALTSSKFDADKAPDSWRPEYGRHRVIYMRKVL